ncbi:MAG TPA: hypothetical protein VIJ52_03360 [Pseudolabrys sp.]
MEAFLIVIVGIWTWLNDTLQGITDKHPFLCLFFGVMYGLWQVEKSVHRHLDLISQQISDIARSR